MSANVASADAEAKPKRPASKGSSKGRRKYPPKSAKAKEASRAKYLAKKLASGDELTEAQLASVEELGGRDAVLEREAKRKERAAALEQAKADVKRDHPHQAYVSGLPASTTSEGGLAALQAEVPGVSHFVAVRDRQTDECRGFGFAVLDSKASLDALVALDGAEGLLGCEEALKVPAARKLMDPTKSRGDGDGGAKPKPRRPRPPRKPKQAAAEDA